MIFFSFEVFMVDKKIEQKASLSKNAMAHFNSTAVWQLAAHVQATARC